MLTCVFFQSNLVSFKPWVVDFDVLHLLPPFSQVSHLLSEGHRDHQSCHRNIIKPDDVGCG